LLFKDTKPIYRRIAKVGHCGKVIKSYKLDALTFAMLIAMMLAA